jgi:hypothetical protein
MSLRYRNKKGLNPGVYFILDPAHLDIDKINHKCAHLPSTGKLFKLNGYTMFLFPTRYGACETKLLINNEVSSIVDTDYGDLLVVPEKFIKSLHNDYVNWLIEKYLHTLIGAFNLIKFSLPVYKNWTFQLPNLVLDTKKLHFNESETYNQIEEMFQKEKNPKRHFLSRNVTNNVLLHYEYNETI